MTKDTPILSDSDLQKEIESLTQQTYEIGLRNKTPASLILIDQRIMALIRKDREATIDKIVTHLNGLDTSWRMYRGKLNYRDFARLWFKELVTAPTEKGAQHGSV